MVELEAVEIGIKSGIKSIGDRAYQIVIVRVGSKLRLRSKKLGSRS